MTWRRLMEFSTRENIKNASFEILSFKHVIYWSYLKILSNALTIYSSITVFLLSAEIMARQSFINT